MNKTIVIAVAYILAVSCSNDTNTTTKLNDYLFTLVSPKESKVDFSNILIEDADLNIINYIYYYNGGGVASGDINNDGLPDLYFVSNTGKNKLYLNKGNLKFEDISKSSNCEGKASWNTGVTMIDINNDGYLDIYVCAVSGFLDFTGHNELFINNGDNTFTEKSEAYGLDFKGYSTQAYFFDYDKDNDLDVYLVNHAVHTTLNHCEASLRHKKAPYVGDVLLNNRNGKFVDVSDSANIYGGINGYGLSAAIADYNNDGWDDIYVCNDFHEDDYYYINNQDGTFTEKLKDNFSAISRFSMGSDAADINNDGYQDIITLDMLPKDERTIKETEGDESMFNVQLRLKKLGYKDQFSRNMLQMNTSGSYFTETAFLNTVANTDWSWSPLFADLNNDGYQDLFISNGIQKRPNDLDFKKYVASAFKGRSEKEGIQWLYNSISEMKSGEIPNEVFEGDAKRFKNRTGQWIEAEPNLSNGAIYVDLDRDGDLDLVTNNFGHTANIYENKTNGSHNHITLKFHYKGNNIEGIGTKAIVYSNRQKQLKQVFKSRGFLSSVESRLHFGLANATQIDSIVTIWPNNTYSTITNPTINQTVSITYQDSLNIYKYSTQENKPPLFTKENLIDFTHKEDSYNDFVEEKLIPYKVSNLGPALAVADISGNGFEDVFIGNSSGQPAKLYMNSGKGFTISHQEAFINDSNYEDNDAVFFDADNDGDLDLYIASGVNEHKIIALQENRLYLNENGVFKRTKNKIPSNTFISTSVAANDYDNDGDMDLFVGNLAHSEDFGPPVPSHLLKNDGSGNFSIDLNFKLNTKVNQAIWKDINNDNTDDLLIATEWDAPKVYINKNGQLKPLSLPDELHGLWQTVSTFDFDNDGDEDILLGNWGLNTKFSLNFDGPLHLYHFDFDGNGKPESLLAYNRKEQYYPLNSKDEMASQMNAINKLFIDHKSYAGKPLDQIIDTKSINASLQLKVDLLASGYLRNDDGQFNVFVNFPDAFQLAPITSFNSFNINKVDQLLVGGNSFRVNTYHGAYSAFKGLIASGETNFNSVINYGIAPFNEQIKQTQCIKMKDKNLLLILSNNDTLQTYSYQN
ncbi:VCBS repeat-containing protein [Winogradskyella psychrotolerans]|uniref:VCBS repeat-containing protein n=1 Tax=Winogradskyella psychrotolerans TaxID=1344585 RepID=UPI001C0733B7|nr:VCBS repeat-containing protein [Winogradskyella psychrotolerans]MBU2928537.1 VCBS repeat-containing protein [Winogradskyella psychrotolerans]